MAKKPKDPNELTDIEKKFVDCYFNYNFNGRLAYKACFPNTTNEAADVSAHRMLSKAKVKDAIELKQAYIRMKENIDLGFIISQLNKIIFDVCEESIERDENGKITSKPDRKSALQALQQLAKLGGFETKKVEVQSDIRINGSIKDLIEFDEDDSNE